MASIIDSFRDVFSDNMSFFKILALAIPTYYSYDLYTKSKEDYGLFFWVAGLTLFFMFGFLVKVTGNVINDRDRVLPPLNPLILALAGVKGIIAIGPVALIASLLATQACSFININPVMDYTLKSMVWLIVVAIVATSFLMFTPRENVFDAFDLRSLLAKAGDLIVSLIVFLLQLVLANIVTAGFIGYIIFLLFGAGPVLNFFLALVLAFNVGVAGQYLAQVHYEIFTYDKTSL